MAACQISVAVKLTLHIVHRGMYTGLLFYEKLRVEQLALGGELSFAVGPRGTRREKRVGRGETFITPIGVPGSEKCSIICVEDESSSGRAPESASASAYLRH